MAYVAVLDACVLIPAALRDTLLRAAQGGLYRAQWSDRILDEVERNLVELGMTTQAQARHLRTVLEQVFEAALVPPESYEPLINAMRNDPKDRHVLAAAVAAGAQVIVTVNLRDFPPEALRIHRIEAQDPDQFLEALYYLDPFRVRQLIGDQAAALNAPSMTVHEVLDRLAVTAPRFAALLRDPDFPPDESRQAS